MEPGEREKNMNDDDGRMPYNCKLYSCIKFDAKSVTNYALNKWENIEQRVNGTEFEILCNWRVQLSW